MTFFLLNVFTLECFVILGWSLLNRERLIQYPFLATCVFLGWIFPQLVGLTNSPFLPNGGLNKTIFMAILCLGACWLGYNRNKQPVKLFRWRLNRRYLVRGSLWMSLLGAFFFFKVSQLAPEVTTQTGGQWSGVITIYSFFGKLLTYGMVIALILHLQKPCKATMLILLFDMLFYLDRIVINGRRAPMIELGVMFLLALWFQRRLIPKRWVMVSMLVFGSLLINSIGDYREVMQGADRWSWSGAGINEILDIDYVGNLQRMFNGNSGNSELTNAVMNIEATDRQLSFDYGFPLWNWLVKIYVPGQLVGPDLKQALMIDFVSISTVSQQAQMEFGYSSVRGTTPTGLSSSFQSFWYFGAIYFYFIGLIMSRWYKAANQGNIVAQIVLILLMTPALHAVTHTTHWFFAFFVQIVIFLMPILLISRKIFKNFSMS